MTVHTENLAASALTKPRLYDLLARFVTVFARMARQMFSERRWLILSAIGFEILAAAARIGALLLVAAAVSLFSSKGTANLFGITISHAVDVQVIVMFGVAIGITASVGAFAAYQSARLARRLGRWLNLRSMHDIYRVISANPRQMLASRFDFRNDLNVALTQVPIHSGLAAETMTRMAQPVFMMFFAGLVLLYQQPLFMAGAILLGLFFLPIILRQSSAVQRNARSFYGEKAVQLGAAVTSLAARVIGQQGIVGKPATITDQTQVAAFFDSFDFNLLANERVGLIVAMADALLRPILFIVLSILVLFGEFSIQAVIGFLGSLAYLLASARSVASLLTNLLRYHPQVVRYYELLDSAASLPDMPGPPGELPDEMRINVASPEGQAVALDWRRGEAIMVVSAQPLNAMTLGAIVPPLLGRTRSMDDIADALAFAGGSFRFAPVPVMEQLCAEQRTPEREARARALCEQLGAARAFAALDDGYDTQLSESAWGSLDTAGRVALRLVPLCLARKPAFVLIDIAVIQALGMRSWPVMKEEFAQSYLVFIVGPQANCPDLPVAHYLRLTENGGLVTGDRKWFDASLVVSKASAADDGDLAAASALF